MAALINSLAFAIFCGLIAYVCFWSMKNDERDEEGSDSGRFHLPRADQHGATPGDDSPPG